MPAASKAACALSLALALGMAPGRRMLSALRLPGHHAPRDSAPSACRVAWSSVFARLGRGRRSMLAFLSNHCEMSSGSCLSRRAHRHAARC